jgi:hypothetical protein
LLEWEQRFALRNPRIDARWIEPGNCWRPIRWSHARSINFPKLVTEFTILVNWMHPLPRRTSSARALTALRNTGANISRRRLQNFQAPRAQIPKILWESRPR